MSENSKEQAIPYSYLVDNIKMLLIFLVVFNHIIAFQLVKVDQTVRFIWYGITIFHMPAFVFMSGYLSKKPQDVLKHVKNLLIPYILGYTLTWATQMWLGNRMDFELLRPSGTVMWYVLALFAYRLTIEAFGKIRFIVPLSMIFALWAGTRMEFSTFLSTSRIVVFFPFFVAGYLWKNEYTKAIRKFKGKIVLALFAIILLFVATNYMIGNDIPVDLFRGNHSYLASGMGNVEGMVVRGLMYLISFTIIFALLSLMPDRRHPFAFIGRNTMGIYFFHYPLLILMNGLQILKMPQLLNGWALAGVSLLFVLILGSLPVSWLYNTVLGLLTFLVFKQEKPVEDEGLEDEDYEDDAEDRFEILTQRRMAIEELAAMLDDEKDDDYEIEDKPEEIHSSETLDNWNEAEEVDVSESLDNWNEAEEPDASEALDDWEEIEELENLDISKTIDEILSDDDFEITEDDEKEGQS